ncbi:MAG: response regulator transcription factor [Limisphaera sp.]|nr:response regulator transcription factor [Limisphaera sp.]
MIEVFIADDHALVRRGLREILAETPDIVVTGEAATSEETLAQIRQRPWDVLILDLSLPGRSGLDVLKEVRQLWPRMPVLILSMHAEEQFALRLLRAGANGYLNKESAPAELVRAIHTVHAGDTYLSPTLLQQLRDHAAGQRTAAPHESLSDREFEVLCRTAAGETVADMARHMGVQPKTILPYRPRLLRKLGLKTARDLAAYARQARLWP